MFFYPFIYIRNVFRVGSDHSVADFSQLDIDIKYFSRTVSSFPCFYKPRKYTWDQKVFCSSEYGKVKL